MVQQDWEIGWFRITIGIVPKTIVTAKLNPEPVIFNTCSPTAKVYIDEPNNDMKIPNEHNPKFALSLLFKLFKIKPTLDM